MYHVNQVILDTFDLNGYTLVEKIDKNRGAAVNAEANPKYQIAAFDLDSTLIKTKSGAKFPKDEKDWQWWHESVVETLKQLIIDGSIIVIFSNQAGLYGKDKDRQSFMFKILSIEDKLCDAVKSTHPDIHASFDMLFACDNDKWRKPLPCMWDRYVEILESKNITVDKTRCCFVGDAAGRAKGWKRGGRKDFSCSDRAFAHNIGVEFFTPEEFFLGEPATENWSWGASPAHDAPAHHASPPVFDIPNTQEIVVTVGCPASGKSTLAQRYFVPRGYVRINRDTLGTKPKCLAAANAALKEGKSIIVDNTSPDIASRLPYVAMAQKRGIPARCVWMQTDPATYTLLNILREVTHGVRRIPRMGYVMYGKRFVQPTTQEGFSEVIAVDFVPTFDEYDAMTPEIFNMKMG